MAINQGDIRKYLTCDLCKMGYGLDCDRIQGFEVTYLNKLHGSSREGGDIHICEVCAEAIIEQFAPPSPTRRQSGD